MSSSGSTSAVHEAAATSMEVDEAPNGAGTTRRGAASTAKASAVLAPAASTAANRGSLPTATEARNVGAGTAAGALTETGETVVVRAEPGPEAAKTKASPTEQRGTTPNGNAASRSPSEHNYNSAGVVHRTSSDERSQPSPAIRIPLPAFEENHGTNSDIVNIRPHHIDSHDLEATSPLQIERALDIDRLERLVGGEHEREEILRDSNWPPPGCSAGWRPLSNTSTSQSQSSSVHHPTTSSQPAGALGGDQHRMSNYNNGFGPPARNGSSLSSRTNSSRNSNSSLNNYDTLSSFNSSAHPIPSRPDHRGPMVHRPLSRNDLFEMSVTSSRGGSRNQDAMSTASLSRNSGIISASAKLFASEQGTSTGAAPALGNGHATANAAGTGTAPGGPSASSSSGSNNNGSTPNGGEQRWLFSPLLQRSAAASGSVVASGTTPSAGAHAASGSGGSSSSTSMTHTGSGGSGGNSREAAENASSLLNKSGNYTKKSWNDVVGKVQKSDGSVRASPPGHPAHSSQQFSALGHGTVPQHGNFSTASNCSVSPRPVGAASNMIFGQPPQTSAPSCSAQHHHQGIASSTAPSSSGGSANGVPPARGAAMAAGGAVAHQAISRGNAGEHQHHPMAMPEPLRQYHLSVLEPASGTAAARHQERQENMKTCSFPGGGFRSKGLIRYLKEVLTQIDNNMRNGHIPSPEKFERFHNQLLDAVRKWTRPATGHDMVRLAEILDPLRQKCGGPVELHKVLRKLVRRLTVYGDREPRRGGPRSEEPRSSTR